MKQRSPEFWENLPGRGGLGEDIAYLIYCWFWQGIEKGCDRVRLDDITDELGWLPPDPEELYWTIVYHVWPRYYTKVAIPDRRQRFDKLVTALRQAGLVEIPAGEEFSQKAA